MWGVGGKRRRKGDGPAAAADLDVEKPPSVDELFSTVETKILKEHSKKLADVAAATHVPKSSWSTGVQDGSVRKAFVTVVRVVRGMCARGSVSTGRRGQL